MNHPESNQNQSLVNDIEVIRISINVLADAIHLLNRLDAPENMLMTKDIIQFEDQELNELGEQFDSAYDKIIMMTCGISARYKNKNTTYSFLETHLSKVKTFEPLRSDIDLHIFKFVEEFDFLLNLKSCVEKFLHQVTQLIWRDPITNEYSKEFLKIFNHAAGIEDSPMIPLQQVPQKYERDPLFVFENLKSESDSLANLDERIELIEDRLNEFYHWQLNNDPPYYDEDLGNLYLLTNEHYPLFVEQCELEIRHLVNKQERRSKNGIVISAVPPSLYDWKATDTDLVELATALLQTNALVRKDGKPASRREMIEHLSTLFGKEIKDPEGKLKFAIGRKKEKAPFLESLKKSFENYAVEREG